MMVIDNDVHDIDTFFHQPDYNSILKKEPKLNTLVEGVYLTDLTFDDENHTCLFDQKVLLRRVYRKIIKHKLHNDMIYISYKWYNVNGIEVDKPLYWRYVYNAIQKHIYKY